MFEYANGNISDIICLNFTDQEAKSVDMCKPKIDGQAWTALRLKLGQTFVLKDQ
jgi:hypothetical protein